MELRETAIADVAIMDSVPSRAIDDGGLARHACQRRRALVVEGIEIALPPKATRRKRAKPLVDTSVTLPASSNHSGAIEALSAMVCMPQMPEDNAPPATKDRARTVVDTVVMMPDQLPSSEAVAPVVAELVELQKQRRFCIKSQSRCDRSIEAFMARMIGYDAWASEEDRKAIWNKVSAARKAIEKGGEGHAGFEDQHRNALSACAPMILLSAQSRETWDRHRVQVEKRMRKLVRNLHVYAWADGVTGFGELGLAVIIGETGDLANYATKERVWKRLGLAVVNGLSQQRRGNADEAAAHGFNPGRRAEVWSICSDSMFRHQVAGDKDEDGLNPAKSKKPIAIPAHETGPYGAVYYARKAHTETREWTLGHRHNDARRVMTKALIEDLWRVWNGKDALAAMPATDGGACDE